MATRITGKQRAARKRNIKVAQKAKKRGGLKTASAKKAIKKATGMGIKSFASGGKKNDAFKRTPEGYKKMIALAKKMGRGK